MSKPRGRGGRRYLPYAFTEQGVAMLSSVLNSKRAVQVNIAIMRTFVRLRYIPAPRPRQHLDPCQLPPAHLDSPQSDLLPEITLGDISKEL